MAFIQPYLTDEEKKKAEGVAPNTTGAASGIIPGGGTTAATNPDTAAPTPGTGFVNLQQYLDTNQAAGGKMANAATAGLVKETTDFAKQAQTVGTNGSAAISNAAQADNKTANGIVSGIKSDASAAQQAAQDYLGAGYANRPTTTEYTAPLAATHNSLIPKLRDVDKSENVKAALDSTYGGKGRYTNGFGTLDQFLVGGTASGRKALGEVQQREYGVANAYKDAAAKLDSAETRAKADQESNKRFIKSTASQKKEEMRLGGEGRIQGMNNTIDVARPNFEYAKWGDAFDDDQRLDIAALNRIAGEADNTDYATKGFYAGDELPPPPKTDDLVDLSNVDQHGLDQDANGNNPDPAIPGNSDVPGQSGEDLSGGSKGGDSDPLTRLLQGELGVTVARGVETLVRKALAAGKSFDQALRDALTVAGGNPQSGTGRVVEALLNNPLAKAAQHSSGIANSAVSKAAAAGTKGAEGINKVLEKVPTRPTLPPVVVKPPPPPPPLIGAAPKKIAKEISKVDPNFDIGQGTLLDPVGTSFGGVQQYITEGVQKVADYVAPRIPKPKFKW